MHLSFLLHGGNIVYVGVCVHMYKGQRTILVSFLRYPPIAVGAPSVLSANNL